jgi:hypothetical protein
VVVVAPKTPWISVIRNPLVAATDRIAADMSSRLIVPARGSPLRNRKSAIAAEIAARVAVVADVRPENVTVGLFAIDAHE